MVPFVKHFHDIRKALSNLFGLLSTRKHTWNVGQRHAFPFISFNGNPVSGLEKLSLCDGAMYLGFKGPEKAVLA